MDLDELLAHQTRLAQWKLRAIGQALLVGAFGAVLLGAIGAAADLYWLVILAPLVGFLTLGAVLAGADAPKAPSYRRKTTEGP